MPNHLPLLTIAIPTYNRSRALLRLLESLAPQIRNQPRIELLISDNASPDATPAVLEEQRLQGLVFRGIRNQTNLGPDGNIAQCFTEATGRYVWIVGDDDLVIPGAIAVIVRLLDDDEYDLLYLRGQEVYESTKFSECSQTPRVEVIHDAQTFTLRTHVNLTFITGNIINRARVLSLPHQPFSELIGTSLVQLGWTYIALRHLRKGAVIFDKLIAASSNDRGGYALYTVFGTNLKRITETWLAEPKLVRIVLNGTVQTFFPTCVLRSRLQLGPFVQESPDALLYSLFSDNHRFYFFLYPLLKLPRRMAHAWLFLCRIVNRIDKSLGNMMLR